MALLFTPGFYTPSDNGPLIYLNCQPNLQIVPDRVTGEGGTVLTEKTEIAPDPGFWTLIKDTESNRVALHSMR